MLYFMIVEINDLLCLCTVILLEYLINADVSSEISPTAQIYKIILNRKDLFMYHIYGKYVSKLPLDI